ncbi:acyl-CoA dehydrogenase family protein [Rhodococcus sp. MSC1_016]|jgi:alkylation response protein AidB-like acyl-CoA dehydrogenase|uniref:acyl-CoA dehydrogenase family protein n=1 Tax=Rhodococcus sp. MSC1_016 TaxID=2909266 RepID=UPI00203009E2|nr:acyl-CoA dehydrogenase family protein [Rhodococcus sp. MSC1_016]
MTLALSDDHTTFRHQLRHLFRTEIPADIRQRVADFEEPSRDDLVTVQRILNHNGLAVPHWPTEWGGRDWTPMQLTIWRNELQLAGVPEPLAFNTNMVGPVIAQFGSREQQESFLPATANLDIWWAQGFSEPDAGSDLASLKTRAVRDGDHYIVTGQKIWTTLAQHADWIFALVRTDPDAKKQKGISFLLIDLTSPGVTVRPIELIDGSCEVNEVFLDEVRVPATNLVGEENAGWDYAKFLLGLERTGVAKVGFSKLKLSQAKAHAATVPAGAGVLIDDPLFAAKVAELENELLALEIVQAKVASDSGSGRPNPVSSLLKLRGSELQQASTELLLDAAGVESLPVGAGSTHPTPGSRRAVPAYLNLRKSTIYSGSSEVQRSIIARSILGL